MNFTSNARKISKINALQYSLEQKCRKCRLRVLDKKLTKNAVKSRDVIMENKYTSV